METILDYIKKHLRRSWKKWSALRCAWMGSLNIVKMFIYLPFIYQFRVVSSNIDPVLNHLKVSCIHDFPITPKYFNDVSLNQGPPHT